TLPHLGLARELARTSVPTLLVNGRWESRFQPLRDWAAKTMPDLSIVDLVGGHSVNIEQAKGFEPAALAFPEHAWPIPPCLLRGETPIHR
ncbi:MAG: hypothetical protein K9H25_23525, partial [Rhodospirillum sp.]|nr:hypothetical protein [Rhodospirillum sp.]